MKVKRNENCLYKISLEEIKASYFLTKVEKDTWMWPNRLGHVNFQALEFMSKERMAYRIPKLAQPRKRCEGCLMSK